MPDPLSQCNEREIMLSFFLFVKKKQKNQKWSPGITRGDNDAEKERCMQPQHWEFAIFCELTFYAKTTPGHSDRAIPSSTPDTSYMLPVIAVVASGGWSNSLWKVCVRSCYKFSRGWNMQIEKSSIISEKTLVCPEFIDPRWWLESAVKTVQVF